MNPEQENAQKRKNVPLSNSEAASFFFIPFGFAKIYIIKNTDFNNSELERFKRHGFERKIKQASEMRIFGIIFYLSLAIILAFLLN
jgi:hypothetical protein